MAGIKVLKPGMYTTIQDLGRLGFQKSGIPVAGAMDSFSLKAANILVGNDEGEACLESTILGPELQFDCDTAIAVTGADLSPKVNGIEIGMWETTRIKSGDVLSLSYALIGCRSYISISGGIDVPVVMNSKSTYTRGYIGGFNGRELRTGDVINAGKLSQNCRFTRLPSEFIPSYKSELTVRVVLGPQDDYFSEEGIKTFLSSEYKVTDKSDRMGYQLSGPGIAHKQGADIISDGIALGSVQVPGHGSPIVMMADRQTVGGYTKIATIITPDIDCVGQLKPGDTIRFKSVSVGEAQAIYKESIDNFERIKLYVEKSNVISSSRYSIRVNSKVFDVIVQEVKI